MILAQQSDWEGMRKRIQGTLQAIVEGRGEDDEAEHLTVDKVPAGDHLGNIAAHSH